MIFGWKTLVFLVQVSEGLKQIFLLQCTFGNCFIMFIYKICI